MTRLWQALAAAARRRQGWFFDNLTAGKFANLCLAGLQFVLKRENVRAWPVVVKIDISPLCNLRCTACVHAQPDGEGYLESQHFHPSHKMPVDVYRRIIDQIKGRSTAVSLYYFGDPLVHPDLDLMCRIAREAGLNVHISTNFSFKLTDERLQSLVHSGVTHLTVCVDGLSPSKYERTRVGGHVEWVLSNLRRLCRYKYESGLRYPKVEVQYIEFEHNRDELDAARALFKTLKVDRMSVLSGRTVSWAIPVADQGAIRSAKSSGWLPRCMWPHLFMLVKYNGDVIPCCHHRVGEQYSVGGDSRAVGNVGQTSLWDIWNSPAYRKMRRLVANPAKGATEEGAEQSFCYGCHRLYTIDPIDDPAARAIPPKVEIAVAGPQQQAGSAV